MMSMRDSTQASWEVWVLDFNLIKEVLQDPRFSSRTNFLHLEELGFEKGIAFASGDQAKMKRKTIMQILRAMGVGKSTFTFRIEKETRNLLRFLDTLIGQDVPIQVRCTTNNF